jgi:hypothetical protein
VKRAEAESIVDSQFPDMDKARREAIIGIMIGRRQTRTRREGARQKIGRKLTKSRREGARQMIGGKYVRVTAQVLPSHVGKRQRIYNSGSKSARMWRESEAIIRGDVTFIEGRKRERILWEEKYHKMFVENIQRYRDNDPNYAPRKRGKK